MLIGPKYKICKRLGNGVFEKCQTQKFALAEARKERKREGRRGASDYGRQLIEMQRIRYSYGLPERQLYRYVRDSRKGTVTDPTGPLYARLELRLDNVIYRLGLASSRRLARQMVAHGHVMVNGKRMTIPSHAMSVGDTVSVREGSRNRPLFVSVAEQVKEHTPPQWLTATGALEGKVVALPTPAVESGLNLPAVIEFYSR